MAKASIRINAHTAVTEAEGLDEAVSLFFATLAEIGMSDKEAAYTMAMDPAQLSRVKSRQARLPFDAMWRLPPRFWVVWRDRIDQAKQLTPENRAAIRRRRIVELIELLLAEAS
jgi:hypothetical protein